MGLVIGMDEAGYGPNLGPLVVTVTAWEVPGDPRRFDFWSAFADVVDQSPPETNARLHVADSKQVYSTARGIGRLEQSVLCAFRLGPTPPGSFRELWHSLVDQAENDPDHEPWLRDRDLPLPYSEQAPPTALLSRKWQTRCKKHGIRLQAIRSDIVLTERFNQLTAACGSKGMTLSRISLQLLRRVWDPDDPQPTLIIADKHGGRNRYDGFLDEIVDGKMIFRQREHASQSSYRVGNTEIRFEPRAEAHFPVAMASMVSKYVRELAMVLFNDFWCERIPGLRPTKGYYTDACRFREQIAATQAELGIEDVMLWRER
ncbi:MAG: hypothetical protein WD648_11630 [Planctomycetaceae bacterium]